MGANDLCTFSDADSDSNPDSNPIPERGIWDLNSIPYSVESSAYYNVAIWFIVRIGIGILTRQCE